MIISGHVPEMRQQRLFDEPLGNHGHVRVVLGDFVEHLTAQLLGGQVHKTSSKANYCPDVSVGKFYFECKCAGRNKETFVYGGRLEKDREFAATRWLAYVIWHHTTDTTQPATVRDLRAMFLANVKSVYVVPFEVIDEICREKDEVPLNSAYGGSKDNPLYGSGYRIRLAELAEWALLRWSYTEG